MPKKLLFVVTEDWYFVSHRLALAVAAKAAGYDVSVATRVSEHASAIETAGIRLVPFSLSRRMGNPLAEVRALVRLYKQEKPDLVHHVAMKPVIYGGIAARVAGVPAWVNAIAGLGWLYSSRTDLLQYARPFVRKMLASIVNQARSLTIVQNPDDAELLVRAGVDTKRLALIRGAGVDVGQFAPAAEPPAGPPVVILVARMLWDKGPGDLVEAAKRLHAAGVKARIVLVGDTDAGNPGTIPEETLRAWHGHDGVEWWGSSNDVAGCYRRAHIACLPSVYGEGIPKSLLEAVASGLPVVTTDMPGCREVVIDGVNGILIPPRDITALTEALGKLIADADLRQAMGQQGRLRAEREFASTIVIDQSLAVYRAALAKSVPDTSLAFVTPAQN